MLTLTVTNLHLPPPRTTIRKIRTIILLDITRPLERRLERRKRIPIDFEWAVGVARLRYCLGCEAAEGGGEGLFWVVSWIGLGWSKGGIGDLDLGEIVGLGMGRRGIGSGLECREGDKEREMGNVPLDSHSIAQL